jgi:hypothetical protein
MRSPIDVLKYLDEYYAHMLERPSMYSPSPAGMENMILFIENLRAFILNDPEQSQLYGRFLESLGYGAMGSSHLEGSDESISEKDLMLFHRVADVLQQFLTKEGRRVEKDEERLSGMAGDSPK